MSSPGKAEPLHVGVTPWRDDWDGDAASIAAQGELAERLGFGSFWLPESHFTGRGASPSPLIRLAAVAARTSTLGLGTTSFLLPFRHPIQVAEDVAVLDRLSAGRVIFGVGRGFRRALFAAFDVPVEEKRARFEAALETILDAWRGRAVAWEPGRDGDEGKAVRLSPMPVQQPHPPVWVAAFGPKGLEQAGRLGLPYLASPVESGAALEENLRRHREALPPDVDPGALPVPVMRTVFVSDDRAQVDAVRVALAEQAAGLARSPLPRLRQLADTPVEEWALVGSRQPVTEGIGRYRERFGLTHLIVRTHVPGLPPELLEASLRRVAELGL